MVLTRKKPDKKPNPRKTRRKKKPRSGQAKRPHLNYLPYLLIGLAGLAAWQLLAAPMLRTQMAELAARRLGVEVRLAGWQVNWQGRVVLKNLAARRQTEDGVAWELSADNVRVQIRPATLFSGWKSFLDSLNLDVWNLNGEIHWPPAAKVASDQPPFQEKPSFALPLTRIHNTTLRLLRFGQTLNLSVREIQVGAEVRLTGGEGHLAANTLRIGEIKFPLEMILGSWPEPETLAADWELSGQDLPAVFQFAGAGRLSPSTAVPEHSFRWLGNLKNGHLIVPEGFLETPTGRVRLEAPAEVTLQAGRFFSDWPLAAKLSVDFRDIKDMAGILGLGKLTGRLTAEVDLAGSLANPVGSARVDGRALAYHEGELDSLNFSASTSGPPSASSVEMQADFKAFKWNKLPMVSGRFEGRLQDRRLMVREVRLDSEWFSLSSQGQADFRADPRSPVRLRLEALSLTRKNAALNLTRPGELLFFRPFGVEIRSLDLQSDNTRLRVSGTYQPQGRTEAGLVLTGVHSRDWAEPAELKGFQFETADLQLNLQGTGNNPVWSANGRVTDLGRENSPIRASVNYEMDYQDQKLVVKQFKLLSQDGQHLVLTGVVPVNPFSPTWRAPGRAQLQGSLKLEDISQIIGWLAPGKKGSGSVQGEFSLQGTWRQPQGYLDLRARDLYLPQDWPGVPPGPLEAECRIDAQGPVVQIKKLQVRSPAADLVVDGTWRQPPWGRLWSTQVPRDWGELDINSRLVMEEMGWLAPMLGWKRLRGKLSATLAVRGQAQNPALVGQVKVTEAELQVNAVAPPISRLAATAEASSGKPVIIAATGELGGSPFRLDGDITGHWLHSPRFAVRLQGDNLLWLRNPNVKVRADTDLQLSGSWPSLAASGQLNLTDGGFYQNFNFLQLIQGGRPSTGQKGLRLFSFSQPPLNDLRFDIRVNTQQAFDLKNNLLAGSVRPALKLSGTGALPILTGEIYTETTRVFLPTGVLDLRPGVIYFPKNDPDRPRLNLSGSSTMKGYAVALQISGPVDEPVVTLSSVPPLSQADLLLLVLSGKTPQQSFNQLGRREDALQFAVYMGKNVVAEWLGAGNEGENAIRDRFEVEIGSSTVREGQDTFAARFRLAENVLRTGDSLSLTSERDDYGRYNAGVKIVFKFK